MCNDYQTFNNSLGTKLFIRPINHTSININNNFKLDLMLQTYDSQVYMYTLCILHRLTYMQRIQGLLYIDSE